MSLPVVTWLFYLRNWICLVKLYPIGKQYWILILTI